MKKVLILTYYWPPSGGPGVQRWLKFARYMPALGYEPLVVTVDPAQATYPVADVSLLEEVPHNLKVFYTATREPYTLYKKLLRQKNVPYSGFANEQKSGFLSAFSRFVRGNLFVPDARVGWNRFAIAQARQLINEYKIEILITTSPPHSTQLAGLQLKKDFPGLHWIADLRDPWTDIFYYNKMLHLPLVKKKDLRLEKAVLQQADRVITVSDFILQLFVKKAGQGASEKFAVIPNGYDNEDFGEMPQANQRDFFSIAYVGTLAESYNLSGFIKAVELLQAKFAKDIRLHFTGYICEKWEKILREHFREKVTISGHTQHKEAIARMQSADVLLLVIPQTTQNQGILTGKLFEYMASGRLVLGVGPPDGDAARILAETSAGAMFAYEDKAGMEQFLTAGLTNIYTPAKASIEKYSRKNLTQYLTTLIE